MALQLVEASSRKRGTFHRGWRLRYAREDAGIGVAEMAAKLDVERGSITRWEHSTKARRIVVEAYERHTGYDFEWLWSGTSPETGDSGAVTIRKPVMQPRRMAA